jgi:uncharacterized protein involved in exopolysaccharide biosynthesis
MEPRKNNQHFVYDAFDLMKFVWEKKWVLIALSLIGFLLSIIISLNITPKYKSQVVLFPAAAISLSKNLVETSTISMDSRDVLSFGADAEAERMLQVLHSNQIRDHIAKKFNLMHHYQIDTASQFPLTQLDGKYKSNVKFRKTEFMSIEINVLDTDPQMAADIANEISVYADSTIHNMQKERARDAFNIVNKEYQSTQNEINKFTDSLQTIRKLGVIDYESQASSLNTAYANALEHGNNQAIESIKKQLAIVTTYGGTYVELTQKLHTEIERLSLLKAKCASYKVNVEQTVPQLFIVDKAYKEERKVSPKRSLIVMISTLSTFAVSLILLLIIDNLKARF